MWPAPRSRTLAAHPDLDQLKRQAKELLDSFRNGDQDASAEVHAHYHDADPHTFALHDAQLVIARAYGFESWPKLKGFVGGLTVERLMDAVRSGDLGGVRDLLARRPELARMSVDNLQVLHHAVMAGAASMVRLLMAHGANARERLSSRAWAAACSGESRRATASNSSVSARYRWACRWGQLALVRLFVERGADPIEADAEAWATPLAWATRDGHTEIAAELIRRGA